MAGALGKILFPAGLAKINCKILMGNGAFTRFGQGVAKRQSAACLRGGLSKIANFMIKYCMHSDRFSFMGWVVLENIEIGFVFHFLFAVALKLIHNICAFPGFFCIFFG